MEATLPNRWALAAGRSASKGCVICRGPRLPGARLCGPCKAALKRARLETVSELVPRPSRAAAEAQEIRRRAREVAAVRAVKPCAALADRRRDTFWPQPWSSASGYVAWHVVRPTHAAPAAALQPPAASQAIVPNAPAGPAAGTVTTKAKRRRRGVDPASRASGAGCSACRLAARRSALVEAPPVPDRAAARIDSPPLRHASFPPPRRCARRLLPVREAPAPDRWQVMSDQIVRCGRDGFLAGVICEQRVRIKYCEGYWGSAPQCPSGIANDHGELRAAPRQKSRRSPRRQLLQSRCDRIEVGGEAMNVVVPRAIDQHQFDGRARTSDRRRSLSDDGISASSRPCRSTTGLVTSPMMASVRSGYLSSHSGASG